MSFLLALSRLIDRISNRIGHTIYWLVLVAVLISAANATVRKLFNYSSNSFLEIQWYLFSVIFLFCAGYTLMAARPRLMRSAAEGASNALPPGPGVWRDSNPFPLCRIPYRAGRCSGARRRVCGPR